MEADDPRRAKLHPTVRVRIHRAPACLGRVCDYCGACDGCERVVQKPPHIEVCACKGDVKHHLCGDCVASSPSRDDQGVEG